MPKTIKKYMPVTVMLEPEFLKKIDRYVESKFPSDRRGRLLRKYILEGFEKDNEKKA
jgi:hypothetical protein